MEETMTKSLEEVVTAMEEEEKEDDDNDQYHCVPIHKKLPDDVLRLILMKLSVPKSLIRCSLVSKHFSSILSQFQSLSIRLPSYSLPYPFEPNDPMFDAVLLCWTKLISNRFDEVRSLRIELPFVWDIKVADNLRPLAFISKASIKKIEEEEEEEEEEGPRKTDGNSHGEKICSTGNAYLVYLTLQHFVSQKHPNIESVEITNFSEEHRNVSFQGEQCLSRIKYFSVFYAPKLRLPRLGLVMDRVTLGLGGVNKFAWKDIKGLATDFGDVIFGEVLSRILRDHTFNIQYPDC